MGSSKKNRQLKREIEQRVKCDREDYYIRRVKELSDLVERYKEAYISETLKLEKERDRSRELEKKLKEIMTDYARLKVFNDMTDEERAKFEEEGVTLLVADSINRVMKGILSELKVTI